MTVLRHDPVDAGAQMFKYLLNSTGGIDDLKPIILDHFVELGEKPFLVAHKALVHGRGFDRRHHRAI